MPEEAQFGLFRVQQLVAPARGEPRKSSTYALRYMGAVFSLWATRDKLSYRTYGLLRIYKICTLSHRSKLKISRFAHVSKCSMLFSGGGDKQIRKPNEKKDYNIKLPLVPRGNLIYTSGFPENA